MTKSHLTLDIDYLVTITLNVTQLLDIGQIHLKGYDLLTDDASNLDRTCT